MRTLLIDNQKVTVEEGDWASLLKQIPVIGAKAFVRGLKTCDTTDVRLNKYKRNISELANSMHDQLDTQEHSAMLAFLRAKQGVEAWDNFLSQVYSTVGAMVDSDSTDEFGQELYAAMLNTACDTAAQDQAELRYRLPKAILDEFIEFHRKGAGLSHNPGTIADS